MQKKLIALAIAAAFSAPAFADVTAYGIVDAALVNVSGDGQRSDMQVLSGGLSTSRFGVKTVEDLNSGLKAVVVLEYAIDPQTNSSVGATTTSAAGAFTTAGVSNGKSPFAARQQMLAVAGDFGTFATGYLQTTGYDFAVKFDPTTGSSVSPLQSMTKSTNVIGSVTAGARAPRALAYISPDLGGVTLAVNYTTDLNGGVGNLKLADNAAETKVTAYLMSATYNGGPLSVGGVYAKTNNPSASSKEDFKEMAIGASYDFGVAKLLGTYQSNKADAVAAPAVTNFQAKVYSLSAVAPVGPGALVFSYAKNKSTADGGVEFGGNGFTFAYLQSLSKLTTAYVAVEKISNTKSNVFSVGNNILSPALSALGTGTLKVDGSSTMLAVGLKKAF